VLYGQSCYGSSNVDQRAGDYNSGGILGQFTISASKTFEIQHYCSHTQANNGFGTVDAAQGDVEIYTQVQLWKIA
jgi:hypothetical protein